jgi:hypothetical protein
MHFRARPHEESGELTGFLGGDTACHPEQYLLVRQFELHHDPLSKNL